MRASKKPAAWGRFRNKIEMLRKGQGEAGARLKAVFPGAKSRKGGEAGAEGLAGFQ